MARTKKQLEAENAILREGLLAAARLSPRSDPKWQRATPRLDTWRWGFPEKRERIVRRALQALDSEEGKG